MTEIVDRINLQGRFRLYFDFLEMRYYFCTQWNNNQHMQKRTVTEEEADILQRILMGGFIK
jgi:hypothetical protein